VSIDWATLAKVLGTTPEDVQARAAHKVLKEELALLDEREAKLIAQYDVSSATELERLIKNGSVPEHPSWEHLIEWEAIEDRRAKLKMLLSKVVISK